MDGEFEVLKCQKEGLPLVDAVGVLVDPAEAEAPLEEHAERRQVAGARLLKRCDLSKARELEHFCTRRSVCDSHYHFFFLFSLPEKCIFQSKNRIFHSKTTFFQQSFQNFAKFCGVLELKF